MIGSNENTVVLPFLSFFSGQNKAMLFCLPMHKQGPGQVECLSTNPGRKNVDLHARGNKSSCLCMCRYSINITSSGIVTELVALKESHVGGPHLEDTTQCPKILHKSRRSETTSRSGNAKSMLLEWPLQHESSNDEHHEHLAQTHRRHLMPWRSKHRQYICGVHDIKDGLRRTCIHTY